MVNDDDGGGLVLPMLDVSHTCFLGFLLGAGLDRDVYAMDAPP